MVGSSMHCNRLYMVSYVGVLSPMLENQMKHDIEAMNAGIIRALNLFWFLRRCKLLNSGRVHIGYSTQKCLHSEDTAAHLDPAA